MALAIGNEVELLHTQLLGSLRNPDKAEELSDFDKHVDSLDKCTYHGVDLVIASE